VEPAPCRGDTRQWARCCRGMRRRSGEATPGDSGRSPDGRGARAGGAGGGLRECLPLTTTQSGTGSGVGKVKAPEQLEPAVQASPMIPCRRGGEVDGQVTAGSLCWLAAQGHPSPGRQIGAAGRVEYGDDSIETAEGVQRQGGATISGYGR